MRPLTEYGPILSREMLVALYFILLLYVPGFQLIRLIVPDQSK